MASVVKTMSIVTGLSLIGGTGGSYLLQRKQNKIDAEHAKKIAKDGSIPIGGMTKDGKLWDGKISVDEFEKNLERKAKITSIATGLLTAATTAIISGFTLLLRGKLK